MPKDMSFSMISSMLWFIINGPVKSAPQAELPQIFLKNTKIIFSLNRFIPRSF